jgi:hypothetical protein
MLTRCCVPGCATSGGHKFPKDVDLPSKGRMKRRTFGSQDQTMWCVTSIALQVIIKTTLLGKFQGGKKSKYFFFYFLQTSFLQKKL